MSFGSINYAIVKFPIHQLRNFLNSYLLKIIPESKLVIFTQNNNATTTTTHSVIPVTGKGSILLKWNTKAVVVAAAANLVRRELQGPGTKLKRGTYYELPSKKEIPKSPFASFSIHQK